MLILRWFSYFRFLLRHLLIFMMISSISYVADFSLSRAISSYAIFILMLPCYWLMLSLTLFAFADIAIFAFADWWFIWYAFRHWLHFHAKMIFLADFCCFAPRYAPCWFSFWCFFQIDFLHFLLLMLPLLIFFCALMIDIDAVAFFAMLMPPYFAMLSLLLMRHITPARLMIADAIIILLIFALWLRFSPLPMITPCFLFATPWCWCYWFSLIFSMLSLIITLVYSKIVFIFSQRAAILLTWLMLIADVLYYFLLIFPSLRLLLSLLMLFFRLIWFSLSLIAAAVFAASMIDFLMLFGVFLFWCLFSFILRCFLTFLIQLMITIEMSFWLLLWCHFLSHFFICHYICHFDISFLSLLPP